MGHYDCKSCGATPYEDHSPGCERFGTKPPPTERTDMNQIEKALSDYLGEICGMRLKPHALTGLAKAAIAAMPAQAEPVAWMYVRRDDDAWPPSPPRVSLTRWGATGDYWDEIPIPAFPTPPAGGSDEQNPA